MKIDFSLIRLVPLCVKEKVSSVAKLLDALGIEFLTVWHCEGVIVANIFVGKPIRNLIFMIVFKIASEAMNEASLLG